MEVIKESAAEDPKEKTSGSTDLVTFELAKLLQEFHENLKSLSTEQNETLPQKYKEEKPKFAKQCNMENTQQKTSISNKDVKATAYNVTNETKNENKNKVLKEKTPSVLPKNGNPTSNALNASNITVIKQKPSTFIKNVAKAQNSVTNSAIKAKPSTTAKIKNSVSNVKNNAPNVNNVVKAKVSAPSKMQHSVNNGQNNSTNANSVIKEKPSSQPKQKNVANNGQNNASNVNNITKEKSPMQAQIKKSVTNGPNNSPNVKQKPPVQAKMKKSISDGQNNSKNTARSTAALPKSNNGANNGQNNNAARGKAPVVMPKNVNGSKTSANRQSRPATVPNPQINKTGNKSVSKTSTVSTRSSSNQKRTTSATRSPLNTQKQTITLYKPNLDPLQNLKDIVQDAIKEKKTFSICGNYTTIRRALLARGWIEKINLSMPPYNNQGNLSRLHKLSIHELLCGINDRNLGAAYRRVIMSKLLAGHQVDFYWDERHDCFKVNNDRIKLTLINRLKGNVDHYYTSKQGMCETVKQAHWFQKPGSSFLRHPRTYTLTSNGDPREFIQDFKLTAAQSLLKWIVHTHKEGTPKLLSNVGKVSVSAFHFAISECTKALQKARHEDIDCQIEDALESEWNQFLQRYYNIIHFGSHFRKNGKESVDSMVKNASYILKKMDKHFPSLDMDGMNNIWILKPINSSRGRGIFICRTLEHILKIVKTNVNVRYIIQKYIEKPLLIYNTKFDIRQWFLISSTSPLTIWIYRECYLRFSSQTYNLRKLHEAIHLTNNSVQCKYETESRDVALPNYNMWDLKQFRKFLRDQGYPRAFDKTIYPGMKECITSAILVNFENFNPRKNCFELYGADFMLTPDFNPWLIEINAKPALGPTTPVTARLCPRVLEDLIKVIIDHPKNPKASTGSFELLYKENIPKLPKVDLDNLKLVGKPVPADYFKVEELYHAPMRKPSKLKSTKKITEAKRTIVEAGSEMQKALRTLLYIIQTKRNEKKLKERLNPADEKETASTATIAQKPPSLKNMVGPQKEITNIFNVIKHSIASLQNEYSKTEKQSNNSDIVERAFCSLQKVVSGI